MLINTEKFKYVELKDVEKLPNTTGIYAFFATPKLRKSEGRFLYVGKAINIKNRVKNHIHQPIFKDNIFVPQTKKIGFIATSSEIEALILEANLIKKHQPQYNTVWRDGKSHNYVFITKEEFPRVFVDHQKTQTNNKKLITTNGEKLFVTRPMPFVSVGPFIDSGALKQTLRILRRIFPYRTCKTLPKKACLYKDLNLCSAPCEEKNQESGIMNYEKNYRKNMTSCHRSKNEHYTSATFGGRAIKNLIAVLQGKKNSVIKNLQKEMRLASQEQNFEKAKNIRDQIFALENVFSHSHVFGKEALEGTEWLRGTKPLGALDALQSLLKLKNKIKRIEGYDISNTQGQEATGSMVVFKNGKPDKNEYRKFKVKITGKPNDTAMLKEIISRRLKHKEWALPQIMLIDGGKGQLNAGVGIKNQELGIRNIKIISLAKGNNELFIEGKDNPVLLRNLPQDISNLIFQIRDESHRFAITFHKKLRSKSFIQ